MLEYYIRLTNVLTYAFLITATLSFLVAFNIIHFLNTSGNQVDFLKQGFSIVNSIIPICLQGINFPRKKEKSQFSIALENIHKYPDQLSEIDRKTIDKILESLCK